MIPENYNESSIKTSKGPDRLLFQSEFEKLTLKWGLENRKEEKLNFLKDQNLTPPYLEFHSPHNQAHNQDKKMKLNPSAKWLRYLIESYKWQKSSDPFWRALGLKTNPKHHLNSASSSEQLSQNREVVLDTTLGLGGDTLRILFYGAKVVALERDPIIGAFTEESLLPYPSYPASLKKCLEENLTIYKSESITFLQESLKEPHRSCPRSYPRSYPQSYSVVYIDPMFLSRESKDAKSKMEMQLLQQFLRPNNPEEISTLFHLALKVAVNRVVMKCPNYYSKELLQQITKGIKPTASYKGKAITYLMFTRSSLY